jgi:hypothetical protein
MTGDLHKSQKTNTKTAVSFWTLLLQTDRTSAHERRPLVNMELPPLTAAQEVDKHVFLARPIDGHMQRLGKRETDIESRVGHRR